MESSYRIDIKKAADEIRKRKAKLVCLQFPDGLKKDSIEICNEIEKNSGAKCAIWLGSCFGACDLPLQVENLGFDLIIQFGHSAWKKK